MGCELADPLPARQAAAPLQETAGRGPGVRDLRLRGERRGERHECAEHRRRVHAADCQHRDPVFR